MGMCCSIFNFLCCVSSITFCFFYLFYFWHCIVYPSNYDHWLLFLIFKLFLSFSRRTKWSDSGFEVYINLLSSVLLSLELTIHSKSLRRFGVLFVESLDLQHHMQSVPMITDIVNSNPAHGEVYSIQQYVIEFISDLRRLFSPVSSTNIKLTAGTI